MGPQKAQGCCFFYGYLVPCENFSKRGSFQNPSVTPGMGRYAHLGIIWVHGHPWGPMQWLLGPCSWGHWPPKSPKFLFLRLTNGMWKFSKFVVFSKSFRHL